MSNVTVSETVNQIGRLNISGNVIPANWWHHIKMPSGKPDSTAIVLLSEIIYWYRPTEIRDENTGEFKGWHKRFKNDKLQRSYQSFADQFGFTKREVADALKRLRTQGIVTLELRTINTGTTICNNVLFIEPVPARIDEITNSTRLIDNKPGSFSENQPTSKRNSSYAEKETLLRKNVTDHTSKRKTNTEITTEITTNNTPLTPQEGKGGELAKPKKRKPKTINYDEFLNAYNDEVGERLPHAVEANTKRKTRLKKIVSLLATPNIDGWRAYVRAFVEMAKPFYFGDNNTGWTADIDYLLRETTLTGVREGKFADRGY